MRRAAARRKDAFFAKIEVQGLALTYADVRLKTGYSETSPADAALESKFSRRVPLKIPIVSAPMDRVTEYKMAIELAKHGGLGIIHTGLLPEKQAAFVTRVKLYLNAVIEKPICVKEGDSIGDIEKMREEQGWGFHSFPVVKDDGTLAGVLSGSDFEFCTDRSRKAAAVMTRTPVTAPAGTNLKAAFGIMLKRKKKFLPLVDKKGKLTGVYVFSDAKRVLLGGEESSRYNVDKEGHLRVGAAIGVGEGELARAELLASRGVDVLVLDTAHGDTPRALKMLKELKKRFPKTDVVAGNVSEGESAKRLADAGADGVKVGQGPGSICTTRIVAGIGCPQVTAVHNSEKALRGYGIPLCADGGIRYAGDIPVALGAGADSVMAGMLFAGTDEAPGEKVLVNGITYKDYRGMGSLGAMQQSRASRERYRQARPGKASYFPEGVEGLVPYRGAVGGVLLQLAEGLRRGMGYVGAKDIDELHAKADFHRLSEGAAEESHPHDVTITHEMPNYGTFQKEGI
ncbi:MAG: IMP dehydrogenase [Candidatus Liptonbacteria bacterium]|nr:IMP dehydrogenase [Candidatus Liptonbacteria bacterium]